MGGRYLSQRDLVMATTFNVIYLGQQADLDTTDGNNTAENAGALEGLTFGGLGDPLANHIHQWSPGTGSYTGGTTSAYDMDNTPNENFRIDGGANQVYDSSLVYDATITYVDGTTATITAVIAQDTNGNTYWVPEFSNNADQAAMEAKPIRSLTLGQLTGGEDTYTGLTGDRQAWAGAQTCFTPGTPILTPEGERAIEDLAVGDLVTTRDHGPQPIRWIGRTKTRAEGKLCPIRIESGAMGENLPERPLLVSRQHRMMVRSPIVDRMFGSDEVLVPAIQLVGMEGISVAPEGDDVEYIHLMFDRHEIVFAAGAPTESLYTGPHAREAMGAEAVAELETLFPGIMERVEVPARPLCNGKDARRLVERHAKNSKPLFTASALPGRALAS